MTRRGFTLIEVLVAFVIVAVAVGAALEAISSGLSGARDASAATARALLAHSMMDAVGTETPLEESVSEGAFPGGERWRVTIARAESGAASGPGLWRVDLVLFGEGRPTLAFAALKFGG